MNSISKVGLRTFFKISHLWNLSPNEEVILLGIPNREILAEMRDEKYSSDISEETLLRISYILAIYKQLNTLLPIPKNADQWLSLTNSAPLFNEESALSFLLKNPDKHLPQLLGYLRNVI
ncbi:hypothetical protein [Undibacterium danionis]|uniref:DUF2384 domain-containing protein n=1 Tax=Undibacterium danionis TaxID=1812100 RepID=A0ABV6IJ48_9BURK